MINIEITKPKKLPGLLSAFITFDKYNEDLINRVREFENRIYDKNNKSWEIPIKNLESFISFARNFDISINLENTRKQEVMIPKEFTFKTKPFDFQVDGVEYALNHKDFILGDDQGLGKSKQLIDTVVARKLRGELTQCLIIIGLNSIKYNWLGEIKTHSDESAWVLGTRFRKNGKQYEGSVKDRIEDLKNRNETFLITNVETLRNDEFIKAVKQKKGITLMAVDEAHYCRNSTSNQGKNLIKLSNIPYKIAMTGTPLVNSPLDFYSILKWLGIEKADLRTFRNYYCKFGGYGNHQVVGYKNLDVLRNVVQSNMLRRLKTEVLDLPDKIYQTEYVDMSKSQWDLYDEIRNELLENIDLITLQSNPLSQLLRLRQCTGWTGLLSSTISESAKMERLKQLVSDIVGNGYKVVIFSNWTSVTDVIRQQLNKYEQVFITGQVDPAERERRKNHFQANDNCKLCIGTCGAMGVGLTLTAANYAIFYDLPWTKASFEQCADRTYRIGQNKNVTIISLIAKDTIDERIQDIIYTKGELSDLLVDGKFNKLSRYDMLRLLQ